MGSLVLTKQEMNVGNTENRFYLAFNDPIMTNSVASLPGTTPIHYDLTFGTDMCMVFMNFEDPKEDFRWAFRKSANFNGETFKITLYRMDFKSNILDGNVRVFEQNDALKSTMFFLKALLATFNAPIRRIEITSTDVVRPITTFVIPPIINTCQTLILCHTPSRAVVVYLLSCITVKEEIFTPMPLVLDIAREELQEIPRLTVWNSSHLTTEDVFSLCTIDNTFNMPKFTAKELNQFMVRWASSDEKKMKHVEFSIAYDEKEPFNWEDLIDGFNWETAMPRQEDGCDLKRADGAIATFGVSVFKELSMVIFSFFASYPGDEPFVDENSLSQYERVLEKSDQALQEHMTATFDRRPSTDYVVMEQRRAFAGAIILTAKNRHLRIKIHFFGQHATRRTSVFL